MKHLKKFCPVVLIAFLGLLLITCQKEDQVTLSSDTDTEIVTPQLKSAVTLTPEYLKELIEVIKSMMDEGVLNIGNGNALIAKIENALKNLEKGNESSAINQINALINQIDEFTNNGTLTVEEGETLLTVLEEGIVEETEGTFVDPRDSKEYGWIKIGDQIWMAENLAYLPSVNTSAAEERSTEEPRYYVYGYEGGVVNDAKTTYNFSTYGVLYNWPVAVAACLVGWHLPIIDEYNTLAVYLGGVNVAGGKMKEEGFLHWSEYWFYISNPNNTNFATNSSGFTGLPGGAFRTDGDYHLFTNLGGIGRWWTATFSGASARYIGL